MDALLHESELKLAAVAEPPVAVKLTAVEFPAEELEEIFNLPVAAPALAGLNCTVSVRDCPGDNFAGSVPPDTENPVPCRETAVISRGQVPTDFNVTDWVAAVFTGTVPKARLVVLTLIVDTTPVRLIT
jgi:hypothetical protein